MGHGAAAKGVLWRNEIGNARKIERETMPMAGQSQTRARLPRTFLPTIAVGSSANHRARAMRESRVTERAT